MGQSQQKPDPNFEHPIKKYNFRKEDFTSYEKKPYYTVPEDDSALEKELQDKENKYKHFKYYDDIPQYMEGNIYTTSTRIQSCIIYFTVTGWMIGKAFAIGLYGRSYLTKKLQRKVQIKSVLASNLIAFLYLQFQPEFSFKNAGYLAPQIFDQKVHNQLEYEMDIFKNVDKIKYEDQYPEYQDVVKIETNRMLKQLERKVQQREQEELVAQ